MPANQTAFESFINVTDVENSNLVSETAGEATTVSNECVGGNVGQPIDCRETEVFHLMMKAAIEQFKDIHFYGFGKPVTGSNERSCDMAWRFRPKEGKTVAFYKDYRTFVISRLEDCSLSIDGIGEYHTGVNARKKKKNQKPGFKKKCDKDQQSPESLHVVGETVIDTLPLVDERSFSWGKYLIYVGGGD